MKKSFFLYPTTNGDIVLSGYPSWVRYSNVYPFRLYTFLLDEHSSQRIGERKFRSERASTRVSARVSAAT